MNYVFECYACWVNNCVQTFRNTVKNKNEYTFPKMPHGCPWQLSQNIKSTHLSQDSSIFNNSSQQIFINHLPCTSDWACHFSGHKDELDMVFAQEELIHFSSIKILILF